MDKQIGPSRSHNESPLIIPKRTHKTRTFLAKDLAEAYVIGQVDFKFVACVIGHNSTEEEPVLALIDQHAADERVRVERILQELCEAALDVSERSSNPLDTPQNVLLTEREAMLLFNRDGDVLRELRRWGLVFQKLSDDVDFEADRVQVSVVELPYLLHEKVWAAISVFVANFW